MKYLSVCSGIEAATQAWAPLGWAPVAFSEIEPFPCAVLKHHYPDVPNWGDMTKFKDWPDATVDVLCGGTPCQSFSVAGLRQGLDDPRGNLMLTFGAIADRYRPKWLVWENVPGVLSSDGGRDFAAFVGLLGQLGYGWAYRVLDAQHVRTRRFPFAVPQRRRRVFVVGYLGDYRRAAAVLFDRESLSGHPAPRRKAGQGFAHSVAPSLTGSGRGVERAGETRGQDPVVAVSNSGDVGYCLTASAQGSLDAETETMVAVAHSLRGEGFNASEDGTGRGTPLVAWPLTAGMAASAHRMPQEQGALLPIAIQERAICENLNAGPDGVGVRTDGASYTLEARTVPQAVAFSSKDYGGDALAECSPTLRAGTHDGSHANGGVMPAVAFQNRVRGDDGRGYDRAPAMSVDVVGTLETVKPWNVALPAVAFDMRGREGGSQLEGPHDTANIRAADGGSSRSYVAMPWAVRRLTPTECEKLMGFSEGFTRIPYRGKPADLCPDGPRYKALGNSWAVNAATWIGERIAEVDGWQA